MKHISIAMTLLIGMLLISSVLIAIFLDFGSQNAQGEAPVLDEPYVYEDYDPDYQGGWVVVFEVEYTDIDGDEGDVILYIDGIEFTMDSEINDVPEDGKYYFKNMKPETIQDDDEFFFYAENIKGESTYLDDNGDPFVVGNFMGWGEKPILSGLEVYYDEGSDDYVFNVTYRDVEEDEGFLTLHVFNDTEYKPFDMHSTGGNTLEGQNFEVSVSDTEIDEEWYFYIEAYDEAGSTTYIPDQSQEALLISDVVDWDSSGDGDGNGNGDGGGGFGLPKGWFDDPEVVVGILGLVAIGAGSAFGMYRRKKKHSRFSELLTEMDKIYGSYKTNPKRCELELEKMKATINEDLKKSTIDDNNYNILKGRIDEILSEIRSESIRGEVAELPKDIEIKIKDMLIDGEITREEYDKILPIIKGSSMSTDEKEKVKKMVESYMVEEEKE